MEILFYFGIMIIFIKSLIYLVKAFYREDVVLRSLGINTILNATIQFTFLNFISRYAKYDDILYIPSFLMIAISLVDLFCYAEKRYEKSYNKSIAYEILKDSGIDKEKFDRLNRSEQINWLKNTFVVSEGQTKEYRIIEDEEDLEYYNCILKKEKLFYE